MKKQISESHITKLTKEGRDLTGGDDSQTHSHEDSKNASRLRTPTRYEVL